MICSQHHQGSWGSQPHHALIPQNPAVPAYSSVRVDRRLGLSGKQGRPFGTPSGRGSRATGELRPFTYLQIKDAYWLARDGEV